MIYSLRHFIGLCVFVPLLYGFGAQTALLNGVWQLIGYPGDYNNAGRGSFAVDSSLLVYDLVDDNATWAGVDDVGRLLYSTPTGLDFVRPTGSYPLDASVGVFAFKNVLFSINSPRTQDNSKIDFKFPKATGRQVNMPMREAYFKAETNDVVIKITYQGDYEGDIFRVRYDNVNYEGYLQASFNYQSPGQLQREKPSSERFLKSSLQIGEIFDFNLSDNNVTAIRAGIIRENYITSYNDDAQTALEIYSFEDGIWKNFNTKNGLYARDFNHLRLGQGYWVRMEDPKVRDDNETKIGFLHSANSALLPEDYKNLKSGWNVLSLPESQLLYSTTGLFLPRTSYDLSDSGGINLFFGTNNNETISLDMNLSFAVDAGHTLTTTSAAAQYINAISYFNEFVMGQHMKIRAFPAFGVPRGGSVGSEGLIILSNDLFEINSTHGGIATLAGNAPAPTTYGFSRSVFDEKVLGIDFRKDLNATNLDATVIISSQNVDSTNIVSDLNSTDKASILSAMSRAVQFGRSYWIQTDFNQTQPLTTAQNFTQMLLASTRAFSVRDAIFTKAFKVRSTGTFIIRGSTDLVQQRVNGIPGNVATAQAVSNFINNFTATTLVRARPIGVAGQEIFAIIGPSKNIDLMQADSKTLFENIPLTSPLILENERNQASFRNSFTHFDLMGQKVNIPQSLVESRISTAAFKQSILSNGIALGMGTIAFPSNMWEAKRDFKNNPVWAPNFSIDENVQGVLSFMGKTQKEVLGVVGLDHNSRGIPFWRHIDTTKSPSTWLSATDAQNLLYLSPSKGYLVKLKNKNLLSEDLKSLAGKPTFRKDVRSTFSNTVNSLGIGVTTNQINHDVAVRFNSRFINPGANSQYGVYATFFNKKYRLAPVSGSFRFTIDSVSLSLPNLPAKSAPYEVLIEAYDGLGNSYADALRPKFSIPFNKPPLPDLDYSEKGDLIVNNKATNLTLESYRVAISDVVAERTRNILTNEGLRYSVAWKHPFSPSLDGAVAPVRFVFKDKVSDLYSDQKVIPYAPLKSTHVLEATREQPIDYYPFSMLLNTQFNKNYGVSIQLLQPQKHGGVKMAYFPEFTHSQAVEGAGMDMSTPVYLKVTDHPVSLNAPFAVISYRKAYEGKRFYVEFQGKLYQGLFPNLGSFATDGDAYDMGASKLTIDILANRENAIQATTTAGVEVVSPTKRQQAISIQSDGSTGPLPSLPAQTKE